MSETETNAPPTPENGNSGESPPSEAPGSEKSEATLEKTGFRWGTDAPKELQGRTAAETAQYVEQLQGAVQNFLSQSQQQQASQQSAAQQAAARQQATQMASTLKEIGEGLYSDPEKSLEKFAAMQQAEMGQQVGQTIGNVLTPLYHAQAASAREIAKTDDRDLWNKYGSEIEQVVNALPLAQRANPEAYKAAAKIVRGNHFEEIATERAQAIAAQASSGVEGGYGGTSYPTTGGEGAVVEKLKESDYGKQLVEKYGPRGVIKHLEKMTEADGTTPMQFAEMAARTKVDRNPNNAGEWFNRTVGVKEVKNG